MRFPWRGALGFALSAALLYWALHSVSWTEIAHALRISNPALWALAIVLSQCTFPLRAVRWRTILHPVAPAMSFGPLWRATAIGMMANNVLPGRIGELARAYALNREVPRIPFAAALASLVIDRTFDAVAVLTLLVVALLDPGFTAQFNVDNRTVNAGIAVSGAIVVASFAVLYSAVFMPGRIESAVSAVTRRVAPLWEPRVRTLVHGFCAGLGVLRDPRRFVAVLLWAFAHWIVNAAAFWAGFLALGLHVPFTAAFFVLGVIVIAVALPSLPAFVGPFEAAAIFALGRYGIPESQAAAWALAYHGLSFIPITLIGIWYVARMGMSLGDLRRQQTQPGEA